MKKLQCSKLAEKLYDTKTGEVPTIKAVKSRLERLHKKLDSRLSTKGILIVKENNFYFSSSVSGQ